MKCCLNWWDLLEWFGPFHKFPPNCFYNGDRILECIYLARKKKKNWCDLPWFGFGSAIGAGIFILAGQEAHDHVGPAIVFSYVAPGLSVMLLVFFDTEFAVEIPFAGESFAYPRVESIDLAAFITVGNTLLESIIRSAAVARSWTSYFATLLDFCPDSLRILTDIRDGFSLLEPIAVCVLAITATISKTNFHLNWIASAIKTVVILFVTVAGFAHAKTSSLQFFLSHGAAGSPKQELLCTLLMEDSIVSQPWQRKQETQAEKYF
ncbi:hypothetical protein CDL12_12487 [Handroanthus impetiginosus]|uniref:Amino acid permease/ SLC12A domain-containing protein n=1 Tax=Handroanthus impetiginosus TaxID=429701 RepID=A0A2G9HBI4_9LAMI|nr:hypothetical protein CDL12_12487 [Handroanthus impetiginosus]